MRQCMILHNQYPWDPSTSTQTEIGKLKDDDYVVAFHPRSQEVLRFIQRVKTGRDIGDREFASTATSAARHSGPERAASSLILRWR